MKTNLFVQWMRVIAGVVVAGAMAATAWAAWEGTQGAALSLSGKVASVDAQQNILKVRSGLFKQVDFVVEDSTKISDGSGDMKLEDVKPGDAVTVVYHEEGQKHIARSLLIDEPAGTQKAPSATP